MDRYCASCSKPIPADQECLNCVQAVCMRCEPAVARHMFVRLESGLEPSVDEPIFSDVIAERNRQDAKWGTQRHSIVEWLTILGEEHGETMKAGLESYFQGRPLADLRGELIQEMAVALAIIEGIDSFEEGRR